MDDGSSDKTLQQVQDFIADYNTKVIDNNKEHSRGNTKTIKFVSVSPSNEISDSGTAVERIVVEKNQNLVLYIFQENQGVSKARNKGIQFASGKFITFLDSDDTYHPKHLETRFEVLVGEKCDFLNGGVEIIGNEFVPDKNDLSKLISIKDCVVGGTFFISKEIIKTLGGFDIVEFSDDSAFYDKVEKSGMFKICTLSEKKHQTYLYNRNSQDSICNSL